MEVPSKIDTSLYGVLRPIYRICKPIEKKEPQPKLDQRRRRVPSRRLHLSMSYENRGFESASLSYVGCMQRKWMSCVLPRTPNETNVYDAV